MADTTYSVVLLPGDGTGIEVAAQARRVLDAVQAATNVAFDIEARDVRGVLRGLAERFPRMAPHLEEGIAVAIDGEIFQDALFEPVRPDSEVHIMPKIGGG